MDIVLKLNKYMAGLKNLILCPNHTVHKEIRFPTGSALWARLLVIKDLICLYSLRLNGVEASILPPMEGQTFRG